MFGVWDLWGCRVQRWGFLSVVYRCLRFLHVWGFGVQGLGLS